MLATALAVNLRMAMYSASLTPYLGRAKLWQRAAVAYLLVDQSYALSHLKYETEPALTLSERLRYFFGVITPVAPDGMWPVSQAQWPAGGRFRRNSHWTLRCRSPSWR